MSSSRDLPVPASAVAESGLRRDRRPARRRRLIAAAALAAALALVAGCGNSADPDTWAQAEEAGVTDPDSGVVYASAVEQNFMRSCLLANQSPAGGDLDDGEAQVLCGCAFGELRDSLTLQEFNAVDKALRQTPNPSDLDEDPEVVWDDHVEDILKNCARRVDA